MGEDKHTPATWGEILVSIPSGIFASALWSMAGFVTELQASLARSYGDIEEASQKRHSTNWFNLERATRHSWRPFDEDNRNLFVLRHVVALGPEQREKFTRDLGGYLYMKNWRIALKPAKELNELHGDMEDPGAPRFYHVLCDMHGMPSEFGERARMLGDEGNVRHILQEAIEQAQAAMGKDVSHSAEVTFIHAESA